MVSPDVLTALVEAGALAPSGDNCQPWRFRWDGRSLRVRFLAHRAESLYDVEHAASWTSLGAVLTNMRVAGRHLGVRLSIDLFPPDEPPDVVVRVGLAPTDAAPDPLFPAIEARCVNRRPYRREPLPPTVRDELRALAESAPGLRLSWIEAEGPKARIAALAAQNDRVLFENRALHAGLYRWLRWTPAEADRTRDGMPIGALELHPVERPGFRLLGSWPWARFLTAVGVTRALPARAFRTYRRSAAIALLTVDGRRREDFVGGGEILERIWLTATSRGLAFQPITGLTFLLLRLWHAGGEGLGPHHRALLETLARTFREIFPEATARTPVTLVRLGVAAPPSARAPRLPVESIFATE